MGNHCSSAGAPRGGTCVDESRFAQSCGVFDDEPAGAQRPVKFVRQPGLSLTDKGLVICADTADDLVRALPFEIDADLEHLYALPDGRASPPGPPAEPLNYDRDVGARCEAGNEDADQNQDNFLVLQVDDLSNPWGLYSVADGHGPFGCLVSALLVHEVPGLLLGNPALHRDSSLALYQTYVSVGEMVSTCQYVDASISGSTLSTVLLRDGVLHVCWLGDSKVVVGRLAARPQAGTGGGPPSSETSGLEGHGPVIHSLNRARPAERRPGARGAPPVEHPPPPFAVTASGPSRSPGPPSLLRAVELTAEQQGNQKDELDTMSTPHQQGLAEAHLADLSAGSCGRQRSNSGTQRVFGSSDAIAPGESASCTPEVRRLRLKAEDVFVILGTSGLWNRLSPAEAVTIVGQNLHRPAACAADALVKEVERRRTPAPVQDDITVLVLYLQGEGYVQQGFGPGGGDCRLFDQRGMLMIREAQDHLAGCGCLSHQRLATEYESRELHQRVYNYS